MNIILNHASMIPIYEQLTSQIKRQILDGDLGNNSGLPSVRALAAELRISALTVKKAYDLLEAEGYVVTVHGKGTYVAADPQLMLEQRQKNMEDEFAKAISRARALGFRKKEIQEMITILLEDET